MNNGVRPKKHLGQHFLHNKEIASKIVGGLTLTGYNTILEIGPGMGVLTHNLVKLEQQTVWLVEIDRESISYLRTNFTDLTDKILEGDFLKLDLKTLFVDKFAIIGNFPYNISSQIFFRLIQNRNQVPEMVCMIQKEVADRIASPPGNKTYGILSVLLGAYFDIEYLFTVKPGAFHPPPKVNSAVIRLRRNNTAELSCSEDLFFKVVKQGFQNRRKTLRNALKPLNLPIEIIAEPILNQRAEQLSVKDFESLTSLIERHWKSK